MALRLRQSCFDEPRPPSFPSQFRQRTLVVSLAGLLCTHASYAVDKVLDDESVPVIETAVKEQVEVETLPNKSATLPEQDKVLPTTQDIASQADNTSINQQNSESPTEPTVSENSVADKAENALPVIQQQDTISETLEKLDAANQSEDGKIDPDSILPEYHEENETQEGDQHTEKTPVTLEKSPPTFFERLYEKYFGDEIGTIEKIIVITNIVDADDLVENVQQALSQVSVDEFADFRVALPRLRSMSREAASAVGYYDARFVFRPINARVLSVTITPGDPVTVSDSLVRIQGDGQDEEPLTNVLKRHQLNQGDVFNSGNYDTLKAQLMLTAQRMGYFESRWKRSQVQVYLPQNTADVDLVLDTGPRYHFGETLYVDKNGEPYELSADQQVVLDKDIFNMLKPYQSGELFDQKQVVQYSANLLSTQYFNAVDVKVIKPKIDEQKLESSLSFSSQAKAVENINKEVEQAGGIESTDKDSIFDQIHADVQLSKQNASQSDQDQQKQRQQQNITKLEKQAMQTKHVPVQVMLDSTSPNNAEIGLGYGTDSSFRLTGKLSRRLFNSHGDKLTATMALSEIQQAAQIKYIRPIGSPLDDTVTFFAGHNIERRDSGVGVRDLTINETTAGVQRDSLKYGWNHSFSVKYQADQLKTKLSAAEVANLPAQFNDSRNQQALLFGYGAYKTVLRGGLNPYQGHKQQYQLEVASKDVVSDADFARLRMSLDGLYSFGEDNASQVLASFDAATIVTDEFSKVPYNLRYFAGGDNSLRGYSYKSLSPEVDDYLIGGQHLVVGSLEYNHRVFEKWRFAVFADAGNAYNKKMTNETKYSAGLGARWESPVGPLRIDVAAGLAETSVPIRVHFFIGPPF